VHDLAWHVTEDEAAHRPYPFVADNDDTSIEPDGDLHDRVGCVALEALCLHFHAGDATMRCDVLE
jgi:hypothetical protein